MTQVHSGHIAAIHVLAGKIGMDDDTRRDFLFREAGVRSSRDLDTTAAGRIIEKLRDMAGQGALPAGAVAGLGTPIGKKLRALWIAGYDLGLVADRTDRAMLSFVERQTGVSHVRFFTDPRQGTQAVEGLKAWLARDGGVKWLDKPNGDGLDSRRAVVLAQWQRLVEHGGAIEDGFFEFARRVTRTTYLEKFTAQHYDQVRPAIGRKLRAAMARQPRKVEDAA